MDKYLSIIITVSLLFNGASIFINRIDWRTKKTEEEEQDLRILVNKKDELLNTMIASLKSFMAEQEIVNKMTIDTLKGLITRVENLERVNVTHTSDIAVLKDRETREK